MQAALLAFDLRQSLLPWLRDIALEPTTCATLDPIPERSYETRGMRAVALSDRASESVQVDPG